MTNNTLLAGKNIIVTGASRGIGRLIAMDCAKAGARVGACYYRSEGDAESLRALFPDQVRLLRFDVRDREAAKAAIDTFCRSERGLDGLVNNAGIGGKPNFLIRWPHERMQDMLMVNLLGPMACTAIALPHLLDRKQGSIVNISSISAVRPANGVAPYAASKGGLESFTLAIAKEYGPKGIRANAVRLGAVRTQMIDELPPEAREQILRGTFADQLPGPECATWLIVDLLAHTRSSYVTGSVFAIDGGSLVK